MKRILIVDDEAHIIRVLKLALERAGYEVQACRNGAEAFAQVVNKAPDVLITDIEMPRMSGEELCKQIHESFPNRSFPIFVATSMTAVKHRVWSDAIPNLKFLEKPLSANRLLEVVDQALKATSGQAIQQGG